MDYETDTQRMSIRAVNHCAGRIDRLAARFAAKEATAKVLKTGFRGGLAARHIEVFDDPAGAPELVLHGPALERSNSRGFVHFEVTLTHEHNLAAAVVLGRRNAKGEQ